MLCGIVALGSAPAIRSGARVLGQDRGIGSLEVSLRPEYTPRVQALQQLRERVARASLNKEFPAGSIEIREDVAVLTEVPFSGDEVPLFGVELDGSRGYKLVDYVDDESPDYLPY